MFICFGSFDRLCTSFGTGVRTWVSHIERHGREWEWRLLGIGTFDTQCAMSTSHMK